MSDTSPSRTPAKKRSAWKLIFLLFAILVVAFGCLWWWHNRAIKPVELSAAEIEVVEAKLEAVQTQTGEPSYEKGDKEFVITERELNGLLHEHTKLGDSVRFELVDGAVHARVATDLDPDLPVIGGKNLKARARFFVETRGGVPELILDDLTVWGISLPDDWLGGIKGQNLLGEVLGKDGPKLAGVESLQVERGRLIIKLKE